MIVVSMINKHNEFKTLFIIIYFYLIKLNIPSLQVTAIYIYR